jgi:general secretion pathway protein B
MSYILDALKKSEQERGHGTAPGIQTTHSSSLNYYSNKSHWWPYALVFVIAINLAALLYFVLLKDDAPGNKVAVAQLATTAAQSSPGPTVSMTQAPVSQAPVGQADKAPPVRMANVEPAPIQAEPVIPPAETSPASSSDHQANQASAQSDFTAVDRDELPYDIQQHIPIMEFSAHVYSTNPMQRSIVINGRFMEEGDNLGSDLVLNEITPEGAVFDFQGYRFHQGVVSSWN